jgi:hypothetical protein
VRTGEWVEVINDTDAAAFGAKQSFVFVADLVFNTSSSCADLGAAERPRMELQYFTFERNSTISLGTNATGSYPLSFDISPAFAKFTLRLFHWPWLGADSNRVEVDISISPAFANFVPSPASGGVTMHDLRGQAPSADGRPYSTQVRLVQAVVLDGVLVLATNDSDDREAVEFAVDVELSKLVLSFARFNTSLEYDPGSTRHTRHSRTTHTHAHTHTRRTRRTTHGTRHTTLTVTITHRHRGAAGTKGRRRQR